MKKRPANQSYARWKKSLSKISRASLATKFHNLRRLYGRNSTNKTRELKRYAAFFHLTELVLLEMVRMRAERKGSISVLDVGTPDGKFLAELKNKSGLADRITIEGVGLSRHFASFVPKGTIRTIPAERFVKPFHFDFIFSVWTGMYSANEPLILQNVCNSLQVGGFAFFHHDKLIGPNVLSAIKKSGFSVKSRMFEFHTVLLIQRTGKKELSLKKFFPKKE